MKNTERPRRPRKEESDKSFSPRADKRSDKKSFSGDSRPFSDKKSASSARPKGNFPKKDGFERSFVEPRFGDKKSFGGDRSFGDKKPYGGDRPFAKRSEGGFDKDRSFGDKKPYGSGRPDRPFIKRIEGGFDKDRSFDDNESSENERTERSFSNDKPRFEKRDDNRRERGYSRDGKGEKRENQATSSKAFAPNYNLEKMKSSLPARVQRKVEKEEKDSDGLIRLNRYISNAGIASRRDADELIASGQITVNGKTIIEMGYKVKPNDVVKYGKKILNREKLVYILLNKPKDFITTTEDPNERKTVMDLVANACEERVYPVGRLDRNTTGLLLLTNDGELAEKLSHPSNEIRKIYQVELDKPISDEHFEAIKAGVELEDGFIKADDLGLVTPDAEVVGIEIHSGKNRIVRRIFEHFGYEVLKLDRTTYAGLNKKDLPRSKWRFLTEKEVIRLKYMI